VRAVLVLPQLKGGGAERAALELAAHSELDCIVVAERPGGELAAHPLAREARVLTPATRAASRPARTRALARMLRELRPDVVVSLLTPVAVAGAGALARVPVVHWPQTPATAYVPTRSPLRRALLGALGGTAHLVMTPVPEMAVDWRTAARRSRLTVLPNGLDVAAIPRPSGPAHRGDTVEILTVGRLAPEKRIDLVLAAFALLRESVRARLTVVGDGQLRDELGRRARRLGVADHVRFAGFARDVGPFYAAADAFVLASDFEGFGNVLVEALAHGLPVVATDVPFGPRHVLREVPRSELVFPGSATALKDGLARQLATPLSEEDRLAARRRAEHFDVRRVAAHFDALVGALATGAPIPHWGRPVSTAASRPPQRVTE